MSSQAHSAWKIAPILISNAVFVTLVVFVALAWAGDNGIFTQSTFEVLGDFPLEVIHDSWVNWLAIVYYTITTLWLLYGISTICRTDDDGVYIYQLNLTPPIVFLLFSLSNLFQIGWLFAWDRELFIVSLVLISIQTITLYITFIISFIYLNHNKQKVQNEKKRKLEVFLVQALVQVGLVGYATLFTIFTLINLSIVMTYEGIVDNLWSSTIFLILLAFIIVLWFIADVYVFFDYLKIIIGPYIIHLLFLVAVLTENFDLENTRQNTIFTLVLLIVVSLLFVYRVLISFTGSKLVFSTKI